MEIITVYEFNLKLILIKIFHQIKTCKTAPITIIFSIPYNFRQLLCRIPLIHFWRQSIYRHPSC